MYKRWLIACFVFLTLIACSELKTLHFLGESDNWEINFIVDIYEKNSETSNLTIRYIGEDEAPDEINYKIKYGGGSSSVTRIKLDDGVLHTSGGSCSGCLTTNENHQVNITIEWDGNEENIELTYK